MTTSAALREFLRHPHVAELSRALAARPGRRVDAGAARLAAILLVLRPREDGDPELLLIKRAEFEGDPWSGHIACPGGRMEPGDADLAMTAVRETREETGIDVDRDGMVLGTLDDLSPRSPLLPQIVIRPFVAVVRRDVVVSPSHEVASAFWVSLAALRDAASWGVDFVSVRSGRRRASIFRHDGHVVWGLTERALRQFLSYAGMPLGSESVDEDLG
ncbi:MAG: CoA pyrophosphatase [Gemmatimonadaceae bacterium]